IVFNRAIARLYELLNVLSTPLQAVAAGKADDVTKAATREATDMFISMIAPMMPHLAEQCNAVLGATDLVATRGWPVIDEALLVENDIT
ncbi:class I tRNA ligase family protein, partial [Salmonella enterica]|nr:class I tRNA ligase family protein [Salmonella enterica]